MGKVIDMMKDLSEAMYYRELTKTMQEYDPDENMEMFERYGDGGRRFYDHYRYADGRFAFLKVVEPTAEVMKNHPIIT